MCLNLIENPGAAYSYGVGANDEWGCSISTRYRIPVHQYDCYDPARPACATGEFVFHNECVAHRRETVDAYEFDTLASQIARNGDTGKRLIVKIDVEGGEPDPLLATPDAFGRHRSAPDGAASPQGGLRRRPGEVPARNRKAQAELSCGQPPFQQQHVLAGRGPFPGWVFQLLLVNTRVGVLDPARGTRAPHPLNAPDAPRASQSASGPSDPP